MKWTLEQLHNAGYRHDGKGGWERRLLQDHGMSGVPIAPPPPWTAADWLGAGICIDLPHPPAALRPNTRAHWAKKAQDVKLYRARAAAEARIVCGGNAPRWKSATAEIIWHSKTLKHPDPDNIIASLKAAFDGLQEAGVIANDKGLRIESTTIVTKHPWPGVSIIVRPL
jgi:Holliday junction resolvase RusA-like endonuclease